MLSTWGSRYRGMEFAIASGVIAAEVAVDALNKGDVSKEYLAEYEKRLRASFVLRDMETFRHSKEVLENPRLFTVYPKFLSSLFKVLFTRVRHAQEGSLQECPGGCKRVYPELGRHERLLEFVRKL